METRVFQVLYIKLIMLCKIVLMWMHKTLTKIYSQGYQNPTKQLIQNAIKMQLLIEQEKKKKRVWPKI